mmetsp:Transcript_33734/g.54322  ORF Transcript_33734/g.54322 Transcript_33734/m.54322 type:complete len:215 (+) Transcript_33734:552-1196(+)
MFSVVLIGAQTDQRSNTGALMTLVILQFSSILFVLVGAPACQRSNTDALLTPSVLFLSVKFATGLFDFLEIDVRHSGLAFLSSTFHGHPGPSRSPSIACCLSRRPASPLGRLGGYDCLLILFKSHFLLNRLELSKKTPALLSWLFRVVNTPHRTTAPTCWIEFGLAVGLGAHSCLRVNKASRGVNSAHHSQFSTSPSAIVRRRSSRPALMCLLF